MLKGKPQKINNVKYEVGVRRCAHNFNYADCPYHYCAGRAMLEALVRVDRQAMSPHPIGHDAIMAVRAALRLAGEKPAPEYKPKAVGGSVLTAAILDKQRIKPEDTK